MSPGATALNPAGAGGLIRRCVKLAALAATLGVLAPLSIVCGLLALVRRRRPAGPGDIVVVVPFSPGEQSGGARALQDLIRSLDSVNLRPRVVCLPERPAAGRFSGLASRALSWPLPLPPSCRTILFGTPAFDPWRAGDGVVLFEFSATAVALFAGPAPRGRIVMRDHEIMLRRLALEYRHARGLDAAAIALRMCAVYLISAVVATKVDRIITLTEEDRRSLCRAFPWLRSKAVAIPVPFQAPDMRVPRPAAGPIRDLVMVANFFHRPNVDAAYWFFDECAPHLAHGYTLHLFGQDDPLDHAALVSDRVTVVRHGFVDDLDAAMPAGALAIAPVVSGGGVRIKNLTLASMGMAVVTTPLGNEGIGFTDGHDAVIADNGAAMARRIDELAQAPERAADIGRRAREFVLTRFDAARIAGQLADELLGSAPHAAASRS